MSGKETLPRIKSSFFDETTFNLYSIKDWQEKLLVDLSPRIFQVISLQAVASYERCKSTDEIPQELKVPGDLYSIFEVLKEWHKRWPERALSVRVTLSLEEEKLNSLMPST